MITDPDRNLIVDCGMAHMQCFEVMQSAANELGLDLEKTDFFSTHHHMDHFGLTSRLMTNKSVIYIHHAEATRVERIASREILSDMALLFQMMGFPGMDPMQVISASSGDEYRAGQPWPFRYVEEGDILERAGYHFRCIVTPGHSIAHTCLYEPGFRILIAGDEITPVIPFLPDQRNPLGRPLEQP